MAEPRKRTSGANIDPDTVAEIVRNAMLDDMLRDEAPPSSLKAWRVSVLWTAMLIFLGGLWQVGRAFGLN